MDTLYNIILSPITQLIEISFRVFSKMFGNTGIAILGVSLTVTLLCLPLYIVAEGWQDTERDIQARMKKGIERIKRYFKGDEQYMILSTYYRQNHYHPIMALRSSFGILIQIPFFLAAYHTLSELPDLQGQSFLFIKNMGQPDAIFTIGSFNVNILPIAMTLINCVSGAIYSKGHGIREKLQIYGMAALFLVVLYNSPAGLVVYWTMNNIFSLVKNIFYKMKNPLKVLYLCMCAGVLFVAFYISFIYSGAGLQKKIPAVAVLLLMLPLPLYIKSGSFLLKNVLNPLVEDRKLRTVLFLTSAVTICILNGLVLPSSLIGSSVQEFSNIEGYTNPAAFLKSSFWMSFGLFVFWPGCIFFLFKEKLQTSLSVIFYFGLLSAILNTYIFGGNYGSMDSTLKFIDGLSNPSALFMLLNSAVVLLLLAATVAGVKFKAAKIFSNLNFVFLAAFVLFSILNVSKINRAYGEYQKIVASNSDSGDIFAPKYHFSKTQKNILIFMLDRFENAYFPYILKDQPQAAEQFDGFVYYRNVLSANSHTLMGSPGVYGGYEYTPYEMNRRPDVPLKTKHNEALLLLPSILTKEAGFSAVISDLSWANYSYVADMSFARNIPDVTAYSMLGRYSGDFKKEALMDQNSKSSLSHVLNRNMFWVSLFREVPSPVRPIVYYKGTWWENGVQESSNAFPDWYSALHYFPAISAFDSEKPTLNIITNEATHSSEDTSMFTFDCSGNFTLNHDDYKIQTYTLNAVAKIIKFLKENDCFDNTRIIIASDHGLGNSILTEKDYDEKEINGFLKDKLNCLLLVKDFNSHGELITSMDFMTNADVPSIALKEVVENPVNPFTQKPVDSNYKKDGFFVTIDDLFMPHHSSSAYTFTVSPDSWYNVKDNIFVDKNWTKLSK